MLVALVARDDMSTESNLYECAHICHLALNTLGYRVRIAFASCLLRFFKCHIHLFEDINLNNAGHHYECQVADVNLNWHEWLASLLVISEQQRNH